MSTPATSSTPTSNSPAPSDWNGEQGRHWADTADQHDAFLAPVADVLVAAAKITEGLRVLDIGCGCGATTLLAAGHVGQKGAATGVDISEPMLQVARRRARYFGPGAPSFVLSDVEIDQLPVGAADLVISRFGTMSFADPAAAFANIASALRPQGRLCIATWQPLVANDWLLVPGAALVAHAGPLPAFEGPGPFAQSDPSVVEATLRAAGFVDIIIEGVTLEFDCGATVDDAVSFLAESGSGRRLLEAIESGAPRETALTDVRNALAPYHDPHNGVRLGGAIWLVTATMGAG